MYPKDILLDEHAPVAALLSVALNRYGVDILQWDPILIREQIEDDFGIFLSDMQSDKLQAGIMILTSDNFEHQIEAYETCVNLLCDQPDDFETSSPPEPEQMIVAICEATLIRHEPIKFGDEVRRYAGQIFHDSWGYSRAPALFPSAIMPETPLSKEEIDALEVDMQTRDEALKEVFDSRLERVAAYLQAIET